MWGAAIRKGGGPFAYLPGAIIFPHDSMPLVTSGHPTVAEPATLAAIHKEKGRKDCSFRPHLLFRQSAEQLD